MHPLEIRQAIIDLLVQKIDNGEEKDITKSELYNIQFRYIDNKGEMGTPTLPTEIENNLSEQTIKEIRMLQSQG